LKLIPTLVLIPVLAGVAYVAITGTDPGSGDAGEAGGAPTPAPTAASAALDPRMRAAESWLIENADRDKRVIVDEAMAVELVRAGWRRDDVLSYDEVGGSPAVSAAWTDAHYVVATGTVRTAENGFPQVSPAVQNSVVVASFGAGADAVEVRRVVPEGASAASAAEQRAASTRSDYGAALATNPALLMSDADRALISAGQVDDRIDIVLAGLASQGEVTVAGFPVIDGEQAESLRQVALTELAGIPLVDGDRPTPEADALIDGLQGRYAPDEVIVDAGRLILRYPVPIDSLFD
jgi:hypothetical protein